MSRYTAAVAILAALDTTLPKDSSLQSLEERERAYYRAYPWGERKGHLYKTWLQALKFHRSERTKLAAFRLAGHCP